MCFNEGLSCFGLGLDAGDDQHTGLSCFFGVGTGRLWGNQSVGILPLQGTMTDNSVFIQVGEQPERSSCSRYELSQVQNLSESGIAPPLGLSRNLSAPVSDAVMSGLKQESCKDGWDYSTEYYLSTVVTEVLS